MSQMKEQDKTSEKDLNEMEISNPPDKEFKVMVIKMLTELRRRVNKHSENLNKEFFSSQCSMTVSSQCSMAQIGRASCRERV